MESSPALRMNYLNLIDSWYFVDSQYWYVVLLYTNQGKTPAHMSSPCKVKHIPILHVFYTLGDIVDVK